MIYVGIDDTDIVGTPGTNQLARAVLKRIGDKARGAIICRHQLFFDPRVPYTSKNGSASIQLPGAEPGDLDELTAVIREVMRDWFVAGSDPGLCVVTDAPPDIRSFALRAKTDVVTQQEAREIAAESGCHLEGLGGTEQGVIGALAAVGLVAGGDDGRIVHLDFWPYPDETFTGPKHVEEILGRGIHEIREIESNKQITRGPVDVGKHLRPNWRGHKIVLYVNASEHGASSLWKAVKPS